MAERAAAAAAPARLEAVYPLTPMQQGMLFHALLNPAGAYVVQWHADFDGPLDPGALQRAWQAAVDHHPALRTVFPWDRRDRPLQAVVSRAAVPWEMLDWSGLPVDRHDRQFSEWLAADRARGFDLKRAPLLRLTLIARAPNRHRLVWTVHHLLADGWSASRVMQDVMAAYAALIGGATPALDAARPFRDFVTWLVARDARADSTFWQAALADYPGPTTIDVGPTRGEPRGNCEARRPLSGARSGAIRAAAARCEVTESTLVLGAYALLLARRSGRDRVGVGVTVSGRPPHLPDVERIVGLFINTLPLGIAIDRQAAPAAWLANIQRAVSALQAHAWSTLPELRRFTRVAAPAPLFEQTFVFENYPDAEGEPLDLRGLRIGGLDAVEDPDLPFTLVAAPGPELQLRALFDPRRMAETQAAEMLDELAGILERACSGDATTVGDLLHASGPRDLEQGRGPRPALNLAGLWTQVENVAWHAPAAVAIEDGAERITYGELVAAAARVAGALKAAGVVPGDRVGLCAEGGVAFVVGMLAALHRGAAYVPLDPAAPAPHLAWQIADAGVRIVLTRRAPIDEAVATLDIDAAGKWSGPLPPPVAVDGDATAYVMYTSGSTGTPKGVVIPQRAIARLVHGDTFVSLPPGCRVALGSTVSFDAATLELWGPLLKGGAIVVLPKTTLLDPSALTAWLAGAKLDLLWLTAGVFHTVARHAPEALRAVRQVIAGGDVVEPHAVRGIRDQSGPRLLNGYGPTENTTFTTTFDTSGLSDEAASVPIGSAIGHTDVYVLDTAGHPVGPGGVGELYTGGLGLADGYWQRPDLTAERFVPHPWSAQPGARLYRTGDLVRWIAAGVLAFVGRRDGQVKIRGYRVERAEVEAALRAEPHIRQVVVDARPGPDGAKRLVAYIEEDRAGAAHGAIAAIASRLPNYLVPSAVVRIETWPLTMHGKVDRAALPPPARETPASTSAVQAGHNPLVAILANIWSEVLHADVVEDDADFFGLGGHSLLATVLISRVRSAVGVDVPLHTIFDAPRLGEFAARVHQARGDSSAPDLALAPTARPSGDFTAPLSFAQQRLWFLDRFAPLSAAYHIPHALRLHGALDLTALARAFDGVIARHQALRTTFGEVDGRPLQRVSAASEFPLDVCDLRGEDPATRDLTLEREVRRCFAEPFALDRGPLVRARVFQLAPDDNLLVVTLHHIVADGWSMGVLTRELSALYRAGQSGTGDGLAPLAIQYPDFAEWQRRRLQGDVLEAHLAYWRSRLGDAAPVELPPDRPRPPTQRFHGKSYEVSLPPELADRVRRFARAGDATVFMVLAAAFFGLLHRYTGQRDIVVGTPIANRNRTELESLIGFFVNLLALRVTVDPRAGFADLVSDVRRRALEAYDHQDLPFEMLVEELRPARDASRPPLCQVTMAVHNVPIEEVELPGVRVGDVRTDLDWVRFDLELHLWERADGIGGYWAFATDLYDQSTVERFHRHFLELLAAGLAEPQRALSRLPMLTPAERERVVDGWNETARPGQPPAVHVEVARRAQEQPDAVALVLGDDTMTRGALAAAAGRVAGALVERGIGADQRVGLLMERSFDLVSAMLGVAQAGAAYVPLDSHWPHARIDRFAHDTGCTLIIADTSAPEVAAGVPILSLASLIAGRSDHAIPPARPDSPQLGAYVISTSGSTGLPKGVLVEHGALANHMAWMLRAFPLREDDRVLQKTTFTFDASVWEFWAPLMAGVPLVLAKPGLHGDPRYLIDEIVRRRITTLQLVPSVARQLAGMAGLNRCRSLRRIFIGGEPLTADLVRQLHEALDVDVINLYGPAEATIDAVTASIPSAPDAAIPIGRPIDNMRAYVLDARFEPLPTGAEGELYLSGAGLARVYINRPGVTAERFLPDPFSAAPGSRMYRTGDVVRRRGDGQLQYVGRRDHQVKVRGQRVELGEIEAELRAVPGVRDAAVLLRRDDDEPRLVGYVMADEDAGPSGDASGVGDWRALYETVYAGDADSADPTFDITGWTSSYDHTPLPRDAMRRWRDATVDRIRSLGPNRIIEIGSGTGMLLFQLAPHVRHYTGLDFSRPVIERVRRVCRDLDLSNVALHHAAAHEVDRIACDDADTAILNSVVQYFPRADYLLDVLNRVIRRVAPDGRIFIGDVRNLALADAYYASVQLAHAAEDEPVNVLRDRIEAMRRREEELLIDPSFFRALVGYLPRVAGVTIQVKPFDDDNELARYRYDVVLHLDRAPARSADPPALIDGRSPDAAPARLRDWLKRARPETLTIARLPNARVHGYDDLLSTLREGAATEAVGAWRDRLGSRPLPVADATEYWDLGRELGYDVEVDWDDEGHFGELRATLVRKGTALADAAPKPAAAIAEDLRRLANNPLPGRRARSIEPFIRQSLEARLPAVMIPQAIVCLDQLPRTAGGKVDRQALPAPDRDGLVGRGDAVRPTTARERTLAQIWERLLDIRGVAADADFFALGGHSLLIVMLSAAIREAFGVDLSVPQLFRLRTVAEQARALAAAGTTAAEPLGVPLNADGHPRVFCFPPLLGYGMAFLNLARAIDDWTLWAFDFAEEHAAPVSLYAGEIERIQPAGDVVLLGYSAGGAVAFEVARMLEQRGRRVRALICLDAALLAARDAPSNSELDALVQDNLDYFERFVVADEVFRARLNGSDVRARLGQRMRAYLRFLSSLEHRGRISAAVDVVSAADADAADGRLDWRDWTTGMVREHQGAGRHIDMVLDEHVGANAAIVRGILASLTTPG